MRCVWVEAWRGAERIPGGLEAMRSMQPPVDQRLEGTSVVAARRAREDRRGRVKFEDEPVPGYPLPILPGHVSPGRFERVLRAGAFAVTAELAPPDSADPDEVYGARACSTATSTRSTRPTAAAPIATCRASASARC